MTEIISVERVAAGQCYTGGGAANFGGPLNTVQIRNPVGSGKTYYLERAVAWRATAGRLVLRWDGSDLTGFQKTKSNRLRGGPAPTAIVESQGKAYTYDANAEMGEVACGAYQTVPVVEKGLIIPEGEGVVIYEFTGNVIMGVRWDWIEF